MGEGGAGKAKKCESACQQKASLPIPRNALEGKSLVEVEFRAGWASVRTAVPEGTPFLDALKKAVDENGGKMVLKWHPELKAHEIVYLEMKGMALAKTTEEGIHFFLGKAGIPIIAGRDGSIGFPNGMETEVRQNANIFTIGMEKSNANPANIRELGGMYAQHGGLSISEGAMKAIAASHGGFREGETRLCGKVLVLDKECGRLFSISEFLIDEKEGSAFMRRAARERRLEGLVLPLAKGRDFFQMDGSEAKIPYLFIRLFDGSVEGELKVRYGPFPSPKAPALTNGAMKIEMAETPPGDEFGGIGGIVHAGMNSLGGGMPGNGWKGSDFCGGKPVETAADAQPMQRARGRKLGGLLPMEEPAVKSPKDAAPASEWKCQPFSVKIDAAAINKAWREPKTYKSKVIEGKAGKIRMGQAKGRGYGKEKGGNGKAEAQQNPFTQKKRRGADLPAPPAKAHKKSMQRAHPKGKEEGKKVCLLQHKGGWPAPKARKLPRGKAAFRAARKAQQERGVFEPPKEREKKRKTPQQEKNPKRRLPEPLLLRMLGVYGVKKFRARKGKRKRKQ
ncbi:MAG: hypothetical protein QXH30_01350 [Candidatus Bilamarchaeaceae archaeon]